MPDAGSGDRRDAGDDAEHFGEGERDQRKIRALQPGTEAQRADASAHQSAGGNADDEAQPGVDAVSHLQNGGRIGAGAEERGVTE